MPTFQITSRAFDIWNYISGDNYDVEDLEDIKFIFTIDLQQANKELTRVRSFARYGLPGYRWMLIHAEDEVRESFANLAVVETAIMEAKEKLEV